MMYRQLKTCVLTLKIICIGVLAQAQQTLEPVEIGQQTPDFVLSNLLNYHQESARQSDFAGKFIIIDFWNTGCGPCIKAFPRLDSLQEKFSENLQIITVTPEKKERIIAFLDKMRTVRKMDFDFPFETENKELAGIFQHIFVPHEVWIDPSGKIIATTDGEQITEENIRKLIAGEPVSFTMKTDRIQRSINRNKPDELLEMADALYINNGNWPSGPDFRSFFTPYIEGLTPITSWPALKPVVLATNSTIESLYAIAYGITTPERSIPFNRILIESEQNDKIAPPETPFDSDRWVRENAYCYGLVFPEYYEQYPGVSDALKMAILNSAAQVLQNDLSSFFGTRASFQKRRVKCLVFKSLDTSKLVTTGGKSRIEHAPAFLGATYINVPLPKVIKNLMYFLRSTPAIDETGFEGNVDISIETRLTDPATLDRALQEYGLTVVEEERELKMLVITDQGE